MAGCFGSAEGGNVSPENLQSWTANISNVLLSSTARQLLEDYLNSHGLEEGQRLLKFWEMCHSSTNTGGVDTEVPLEEAQRILQFAEEEMNFDDAEMSSLRSAVQSGIGIVTAISEIKQIAADKLTNAGYREFCRQLLVSQGLLGDGD